MLKDDEIIEELDKKYKIIQKKGGYKYAEDTILLFNYLKKSLSKRNIKLLDIGTGNGILPILLSDNAMIEPKNPATSVVGGSDTERKY